MDWLGIIVAGLVGTAVFTAILYAAPMMGMPKMDLAQILGSMVLPQGNNAFMMGMVMHIAAGLVFAIIYGLVWNAFDNNVTWWSGLIFGLVHSMVAAALMTAALSMHKEVKAGALANPMKGGGTKGMMGIVGAHLAYGLVVALVYGAYV